MENNTMDASTVCSMFEELKESNDKILETVRAIEVIQAAPAPAAPQSMPAIASFNAEDRAAIKSLTDKLDESRATMATLTPQLADITESADTLSPKLDEVSEKVSRPLIIRHTLDYTGNWALIALVFFIVAFGVSVWIIRDQWYYRDNDLKYRYLKMLDGATPGEIERLETTFPYQRNADSIRHIRRRVAEYERLVQQGAETAERARLNAAEAERLKNAAETLKEGK